MIVEVEGRYEGGVKPSVAALDELNWGPLKGAGLDEPNLVLLYKFLEELNPIKYSDSPNIFDLTHDSFLCLITSNKLN